MKRVITLLLAGILLTGCGSIPPISQMKPEEPPSMQKEFYMCGVQVTGEDADSQWHSGTPLTDIAEKLLKERYEEDFKAEQMVYYEEFSLCISFRAYPVSDPDKVFSFFLKGNETPELQYDEYYTILHKGELSELLAPALSVIGLTAEDIDITCHLEKGERVTAEYFRNGDNVAYLNFPDEESAKAALEKRQEVCQRVIDSLHPDDMTFQPMVCGKPVPYSFSLFNKGCENSWFVNGWSDKDRLDDIELNNMPAVIIANRNWIEDEGECIETLLEFVDRDGNFYKTTDRELCLLNADQLCIALADGKLEEYKTDRKCDKETFMEKYNVLQDAVRYGNDELDTPEFFPDVEDPESADAAAYCIDDNGEYHIIEIHRYTCMTNIRSKNEDLNSLYEWFTIGE